MSNWRVGWTCQCYRSRGAVGARLVIALSPIDRRPIEQPASQVCLPKSSNRLSWEDQLSELQGLQEGDEVLLLLLVQPRPEDDIEELDGVVEREQAPIMQVGW